MTTRRAVLAQLAALPFSATAVRSMTAQLASPAPLSASLTASEKLSASMWIYLWDLVDEGYDSVLGRLKDRGLTSISLATAYHAGKFLAPHNPRRKVMFLEDGTVYFRPTISKYGKITPIVNSLVGQGHDLAEAKKYADHAGMQTRSWVVCCHNTPLGTAYPAIAMRNVFGDSLPHNLCPSQPQLRTYLRALVGDIAAHGVDTIELEAMQFQGYTHGFHHEREGLALTPALRFLLGLCFCDACLQRAGTAGVAMTRVQEFTRTTLDNFFASPGPTISRYGSMDTLPVDLFEPLFRWRVSVIISLVEELMEAAGSTKLRPMMSVDPASWKLLSTDPGRVASITGGVLGLGYVKDGAALRLPLAGLQSAVGGRQLTVGVQVGLPESGGRAEFLDRMKTARQMGVRSFNFYNYGFIPLENLEWIRESVL